MTQNTFSFHKIEDFLIDKKIPLENISFEKVEELRMKTSFGGEYCYSYAAARISFNDKVCWLKPLSYHYAAAGSESPQSGAILLDGEILTYQLGQLESISNNLKKFGEKSALLMYKIGEELDRKLMDEFICGSNKIKPRGIL